MLKSFLMAILDLKKPETIEVDGFTLVANGYTRFVEPRAEALVVHTLKGLADMIDMNGTIDNQMDQPIIHVSGAGKVECFSAISEKNRDREYYAMAELTGKTFRFGQYMTQEDFVIGLQAQFVQDDNAALVLKKVGTITKDAAVKTLDDGISQTTTARTGVVGTENIVLPNPISLRPFRTFREVEQPASNFVLRIKDGNQVALFEADGGAWEIEAIANVAKWLRNATEKSVPVIA